MTENLLRQQHWTHAYHWAKSNKQISTKQSETNTEYYCPISKETKVSEDQIKSIKEMRWNTFEQYKKRSIGFVDSDHAK